MVNIIEFFQDSYQQQLRKLSQLQSETYEEAIEKYRDSFISDIMMIKMDNSIEDIKEDNGYIKDIFNIITEINISEIEEFFNRIRDIYINWIDSQGKIALEDFENLLNDINFNSFKYDLSNNVLFRGRYSDSILTPWDMFHIPFNKRYLIGNQRYSLTGQPLLYLGFSILDVLAELNCDFNKFDEVKLCTYKPNKNFRVFDLRNSFYEYLRYNPLDDLLDDSDYTEKIIYNDIKNKFFKFILASICSFERREEHRKYSFCEEYVLPQMLAQIIKENNFNGIIYSSTRLNISENDKLYKTAYKDNVAIFTDYCKEHVYDRELYSKFKVSNPICINQISEIDLESLQEICDKIKLLDNDKKFENYYLIAVKLEEEFSKIKIGDKEYFKHNIGKMHIYLVYNMLIDIRNECIRKRRDINGIND